MDHEFRVLFINLKPTAQIFILYSEIQTITSTGDKSTDNDTFRGLGYVDSHKDVLEVKFEVTDVLRGHPGAAVVPTKRTQQKSQKTVKPLEKTIEIELLQDKTALRSRKGDTGSVLWKARSVASSSSDTGFLV